MREAQCQEWYYADNTRDNTRNVDVSVSVSSQLVSTSRGCTAPRSAAKNGLQTHLVCGHPLVALVVHDARSAERQSWHAFSQLTAHA
jgi:hypothetical protein